MELKGICPIIAAPFTAKGDVDYDSLQNEIYWLAEHGAHGATLFGIAGEYYKLTDEEAEKMRNAASSYIENIMKKADDELSEQLAMLKKARQSFMTLQSKNQQKRTSKK